MPSTKNNRILLLITKVFLFVLFYLKAGLRDLSIDYEEKLVIGNFEWKSSRLTVK